MYKIDKNVPITGKRKSPRIEFPYAQMEINDSFCIPCKDQRKIKLLRQTISNNLKRFNNAFGKEYQIVVRTVEVGLRVWRKQ